MAYVILSVLRICLIFLLVKLVELGGMIENKLFTEHCRYIVVLASMYLNATLGTPQVNPVTRLMSNPHRVKHVFGDFRRSNS